MKVAICDNDRLICEDIERLIYKINPEISTQIFTSSLELMDSSDDFAIYLLDIKGIRGLDIARSIRNRHSECIIIFLTGYREYMEAAFDVNAFHYLVKPINPERFTTIFTRAVNEAEKFQTDRQLLLKVRDIYCTIKVNDILFVESSNKKVIFHTNAKAYEVYGTMDSVQDSLGNDFYRCHRCYLVNLAKISAYNSQSIELINGDSLMLAQRKYSDFVKTYLRYVKIK